MGGRGQLGQLRAGSPVPEEKHVSPCGLGWRLRGSLPAAGLSSPLTPRAAARSESEVDSGVFCGARSFLSLDGHFQPLPPTILLGAFRVRWQL